MAPACRHNTPLRRHAPRRKPVRHDRGAARAAASPTRATMWSCRPNGCRRPRMRQRPGVPEHLST